MGGGASAIPGHVLLVCVLEKLKYMCITPKTPIGSEPFLKRA